MLGTPRRIARWSSNGTWRLFAPSLFSGWLNTALGARRTAILGSAVLASGALVGAPSTSLAAFVVSLGLIGMGWNFLYVAGSSYVIRCYPPRAGGRVQAMVEGGVGIFVIASSVSSSILLAGFRWQVLSALAALPPLTLCLWLAGRSGGERSEAAARCLPSGPGGSRTSRKEASCSDVPSTSAERPSRRTRARGARPTAHRRARRIGGAARRGRVARVLQPPEPRPLGRRGGGPPEQARPAVDHGRRGRSGR